MSIRVDRPRSTEEALELLRDATEHTRVLAGGTDLMVELRTGRTRPDRVIDLWHLHAHRDKASKPPPIACALAEYPDRDGKGIRIGALTTCSFLLAPFLERRADILVAAAREVGAVQIRNRATVGGNLATASPAADLTPALVALGAFVRVRSAKAHRDLWIEDFLCGYRKTLRRPDELIECVYVPWRPPSEKRAFRKLGTRKAQAISKVVVALAVDRDPASRKVTALRCAAGAVAERTVALPTLQRELVGRVPDAGLIDHATRLAALHDVRPIDDVRSSAEYRRTTLQRMLASAMRDLLLPF